MKKITLLCLLLLLAIGVHAQEFSERNWHADKLFTIPEFRIHASTITTQDNYKISIAGGGSDTSTRGGRLVLHGVNTPSVAGTAELQAAGSGSLQLFSNSTGNIDINSKGTGAVRLYSTNTLRWSVPTDATATNKPLKFGSVGEANPYAVISANTSAGSDSGRLLLTGGGDIGSTRGGRLELYGGDYGGSTASGHVMLYTADQGRIEFGVNNVAAWSMPYSATSANREFVFGAAGTANLHGIIRNNTSAGSDSGRLTLTGGGDIGSTRGGRLELYGGDYGGSTASGHVMLYTADQGRIEFGVNNVAAWSMPYSSTGEDRNFVFGAVGTANLQGIIRNNTADGSDTGRLTLTGGGGVGVNRGARIELDGTDRGGSGAGGKILLSAGDNESIDINVGNSTRWNFSPHAAVSWLRYTGAAASITANTTSGSDNSALTISSAGDGSAERGAAITVHGRQHSSVPGLLALYGGETSRGIWFLTGAGTPIVRWSIDGDGTLLNDELGGGNLMLQPDTGIRWGTGGTLFSNFLGITNTGCSITTGDTIGMTIGGVTKRIPVCN